MPDPTAVHLRTTRLHDTLVIHLAGDVDLATAAPLRAAVRRAFAEATTAVVLDLADITFFGAEGLALLVESRELADAAGLRVAVVAPGRRVLMPIRATGVDRVLDVRASLVDALSATAACR
ncbi:STAS domain-containing protein [Actinosynnema sp. NPDC053489]|uniref:STAS domain-containing protein n=1 Tax=Actinosynnema sp. NPDC053489 TaxID=3363916 RepID=UPI0037CB99A0